MTNIKRGAEYSLRIETESKREREQLVTVRVDRVLDETRIRVVRIDNYDTLFAAPEELLPLTNQDGTFDAFEETYRWQEFIRETLEELGTTFDDEIRELAATTKKRLGIDYVRFLSYADFAERVGDSHDPDRVVAVAVCGRGWIGLSTSAWQYLSEDEKRNGVLHELAHILCHIKYSPRETIMDGASEGNPRHGPLFRAMSERIGGDPTMLTANSIARQAEFIL